MKVSIKGFIYHKEAEGFEDCFDRYAVNTSNHKFSVSDGVSKSFFPGIWADLIVRNFVNTSGQVDLIDTGLLRAIQKRWSNIVSEIVNRPNQKYYVRNFFIQGRSAAATFVGLHFRNDYGQLKWDAYALGDSFLFFVPLDRNNGELLFNKMIYLSSKKSFEFDNFPDHFDSVNSLSKGKIKQMSHDLQPGTFLLMTDALSEWFIQEKGLAWKEIMGWQDQFVFEKRISELRKDRMQNDDAAILIINVIDDGISDIQYNQVRISDLDALIDPSIPRVVLTDFDAEINNIAEKFDSPQNIGKDHFSPTKSTNDNISLDSEPVSSVGLRRKKNEGDGNKSENPRPLSQPQFIPESSAKNNYLNAKERNKKKKKRSFIQRKIDAIVKIFSAGYDDADDDLNDQPQVKPNSDEDLNAITNKF